MSKETVQVRIRLPAEVVAGIEERLRGFGIKEPDVASFFKAQAEIWLSSERGLGASQVEVLADAILELTANQQALNKTLAMRNSQISDLILEVATFKRLLASIM